MEIKKITDIVVSTNDNKQIEPSNTVVFDTNDGTSFTGAYQGVNRRGALTFMNPITNEVFAVMPKSIRNIYLADVQISRQLTFKDGVESDKESM